MDHVVAVGLDHVVGIWNAAMVDINALPFSSSYRRYTLDPSAPKKGAVVCKDHISRPVFFRANATLDVWALGLVLDPAVLLFTWHPSLVPKIHVAGMWCEVPVCLEAA